MCLTESAISDNFNVDDLMQLTVEQTVCYQSAWVVRLAILRCDRFAVAAVQVVPVE